MAKELSPFEAELSRRTGEVLHYLWDPLGVGGVPAARDEYDGYLPQLLKLLLEAKSKKRLSAFLTEVEDKRMGMIPDQRKADEVADILLDWAATLRTKHRA